MWYLVLTSSFKFSSMGIWSSGWKQCLSIYKIGRQILFEIKHSQLCLFLFQLKQSCHSFLNNFYYFCIHMYDGVKHSSCIDMYHWFIEYLFIILYPLFSISFVMHCTLILMYFLSWCICPVKMNFNWKLNLNLLRIFEI